MADTKISGMTDGGRIAAGDVFPAVRAGANIKVSAGGGTVGLQMYNAATTAAAIALLGAGAVGGIVFSTATTAAAQAALGGTAVGIALFQAATTAAAQGTLNISTFGATVTITADATAARAVLLTPGSVITGVSGAAAIANMVSLTSANYASITPVATTLYFITDAS